MDLNDPNKPIQYQIQPNGKGRFRVDYIAKHPGFHNINVLFAGKPIVDSPFNVNVAPGLHKILKFTFLLKFMIFMNE